MYQVSDVARLFKDKRKSWKYDLYVQVQISDATTEVSFIE